MAKPGPRPFQGPGEQPGSADTRAALVGAAGAARREVGFSRAGAGEIARRAGCNQALVFYHFGSVTDLLLAALDDVSARRLTAYRGLADGAGSLTELVESARAIFREDLAAGHGRGRSEERRVGKEGRSRWAPDHEKKKKREQRE